MNLAQIKRRLQGLAQRAVIETADHGSQVQTVQIAGLADELDDSAELFEQYGLSSAPLPGAEAVVLHLGANRSHPVVVAFADRRHRPLTLQPGETMLYDDKGQLVHLKADGIHLQSPLKVLIEAPDVSVTADSVVVTADAVDLGGAGGAGVARIGDTVSGGLITGGSTRVKAL